MFGVPSTPTTLLEAYDLSVDLPAEKGFVHVLDGTSLILREGEVADLVGPSGSGKSTLLRALARLMPRVRGRIAFRGEPAESIAATTWRTKVALLPQRPSVVAGTVGDNLMLPWRFKVRSGNSRPSDEQMRECLDGLGLGEIGLDRDAARLSVGQQARVAFARTLLTAPDVLLLDEAEAALDDVSAEAITGAVRAFMSGPGGGAPPSRCVLRVRHRAADGLAHRRLTLEHGRLEEDGRD